MINRDAIDAGQVRLCNASGADLIVWLEPWAQEFVLPARAELVLYCRSDANGNAMPEIDTDDGIITIWGQGGSRIAVFIDGLDQESFSAGYSAPDTGLLSPRNFVTLAFGNHPEARPGGKPFPKPPREKWWQRLFRSLRT
ncbi:hypothetical protein [Sphingomonas sp. GB1N7]|uniref:hypothetical protein n=1 Tax=Parasphingomonas caseinilytica TaxID=3096158 RepID=UPI002FCC336D